MAIPVTMTLVLDPSTAPSHANGFLERSGLIATHRNPMPAISPGVMRVNTLLLPPGLPTPESVLYRDGQPPPDRDVAEVWPPNGGSE